MTRYLERYQQGDTVQVWKELVALGDSVYSEPLYSDAYAVAQETMRRARHNIETLIERLHTIGYRFDTPDSALMPPSDDQREAMSLFEREVGPLPLTLRAWGEIVGSVNFMGNYPRLSYLASHTNPFSSMMTGNTKVENIDIEDLFQQVSSSDAIPDAVKSFFGSMKGMMQQFYGQSDAHKESVTEQSTQNIPEAEQAVSDPLVVDLYEVSIDTYLEWQEYQEGEPFFVTFAPDIFHKSNISGGEGYGMYLPHAAADAILHNTEWGEFTFVEYLRLSFQWGGFPGLQEYNNRDEELLAFLKDGLLPI